MNAYDRYTQYLALEERSQYGIAPDGCYWCGGNHSSEACPSGDQHAYWDEVQADSKERIFCSGNGAS